MTVQTQIIRDAQKLSEFAHQAQKSGKTIGLVPTMGYLHEGHLSLIRAARQKADVVIVSDFVNPTQFGPTEDYATYPRDEQADLEKCQSCGADVLFIPTVETLYPNGQDSTWVEVSKMGNILCGATRPGHFRGVATVVTKLLWLSRADYAFFGEKDFQQLTILRRMAQDLGCPTKIIGMPLVREADGLAMSSRNVRLTPDQRKQALSLSQGLKAARERFQNGARSVRELTQAAQDIIQAQKDTAIQYISIADPDSLDIFTDTVPEHAIMLLAVKVGAVRLIDNMRLD
ncbi:MAG: pantoate--beta-alanine ligase [Proteobacteria bacterium]|nr:pantoate--beta-alanine ligase [Pseudomonadota bacterium]